jgi:hypothetical protein
MLFIKKKKKKKGQIDPNNFLFYFIFSFLGPLASTLLASTWASVLSTVSVDTKRLSQH